MEKSGYYVTFRDTTVDNDRNGLVTMLRFDSKAQFDSMQRKGHLNGKVVVEQGITETHALHACSVSMKQWRNRTSVIARKTKRATGSLDRAIANLRLRSAIGSIRAHLNR